MVIIDINPNIADNFMKFKVFFIEWEEKRFK